MSGVPIAHEAVMADEQQVAHEQDAVIGQVEDCVAGGMGVGKLDQLHPAAAAVQHQAIFEASPGSFILKPRGVPHTFWNTGRTSGRLIEIISPAGIENYFQELAALLKVSIPPDMEKYDQLNTRFGMSDYGVEWIPELLRKYHLRLQGQ